MNSHDRFMAALEGKECDRVPAMEIIVDKNMCRAIAGKDSYYDLVEQCDYFDLAVCTAGVVYPGELNWKDYEKKIFTDKWGTTQQFTNQFMPHMIGRSVIETEEDLLNYIPPSPDDPFIIADAREAVRRFKGKKAIGFLGEDVFAPAQYLLGGPENLFVAMKLEPDLVKKVVRIAEEYHVELYKNVLREGIEVIILGDDYGASRAPMISPEDFDEFFYPGLQRIVKEVHELGGKVIKHTDGNIWPILDSIVKSGVDAVGPLQHECGMQLDLVRERYPSVSVVGNVPVDILIQGSPDQVRAATLDCLERLAPYKKHIISSGNSITSDVPYENFAAMMETVLNYGNKNL